jgi:Phosphodiester glycosidase
VSYRSEPSRDAASLSSPRQARRLHAKRRRRRRARRRAMALVLAAVLAPVAYSYTSYMLRPSSLPFGIRSVEWLRSHHGAFLVNNAERIYYSWKAPAKGGPALRTLPTVGAAPAPAPPPARARATKAKARVAEYVPPRIRPVISPALPGEGVWRSTGRVVDGGAPVLVTTFRNEADYPRNVAYVAWFDHTRTQLALYPGRYEPPNASPRGPMEVPQSQRWRLLATFNSGFQYRDGHGGFSVNGQTAEPLRQGQGTIVAYDTGQVNVLSWKGHETPGRRVVAALQNLPLIVDGGKSNPLLADNSLWGSTLGNAVRVWRSGVGIDRHGNLIYLAADYQTAASLAAALIHAGAVRAVELDINAEWPTLVTYGHGGVGNATKVVPNVQQPTNRYLVPDDRDFFAIYRRTTPDALRHVPFN